MKKLFLFFLILFFLCTSFTFSYQSLDAYAYIQLKIMVEEGSEKDSSGFQLIDQRKMILKEGKENFCFLGNFTLYVTPTIIEDKIFLSVELYTLGPQVQKISKELLTSSGELLEFGRVRVKEDRVFRVWISPSLWNVGKRIDWCDFSPKDPDDFYSEVSIHYTFYCMKNSLADFHWLKNKDFLEKVYKKHKKSWMFSYPEKIDYFLSPCYLSGVGWDFRFESALDPVKNSVFVVYNKEKKGLFSPFAMELLYYRYWGYAPKFIVEGLAGERDLAHFYAKKLKKKKNLIPLKKLILSKDYRSYPKDLAFYSASSFVSFLIEKYGQGEFKKFYNEVTDLTLDEVLFSIYKKNICELEAEWHNFLDEYSPSAWKLLEFATTKLSYNEYDQAIVLLKDALEHISEEDILTPLYHLTNAYFMAGRYSDAKESVNKMLEIKPEEPELWNALGNNYFFDGEDSLAKKAFFKALELAPDYGDCYFKLGKISLRQKDFGNAITYFSEAESLAGNLLDLIEVNLCFGEVYDFLCDDSLKNDKYKKALDYSKRFTKNAPESPLSYLKMGESFLGLGDLGSAIDYLNTALFLERRPNLLGEIYLALGKAYQKKGDLSMAKTLYKKVLYTTSNKKDLEEAKKSLKDLD